MWTFHCWFLKLCKILSKQDIKNLVKNVSYYDGKEPSLKFRFISFCEPERRSQKSVIEGPLSSFLLFDIVPLYPVNVQPVYVIQSVRKQKPGLHFRKAIPFGTARSSDGIYTSLNCSTRGDTRSFTSGSFFLYPPIVLFLVSK